MLLTETIAGPGVLDQTVAGPAWWINTYIQIYDGTARRWIPFLLWREQRAVVKALQSGDHLVILKARQLGLTWLILAYALWLMLFRPAATILLFSKRQEEAWALLDRLKGMYSRLPAWCHSAGGDVALSNMSIWRLGNGSEARAFPSTGGDSYTATFVLIDEADLVDKQADLLTNTQPTIDGGGQLVLLSRADKDKPESAFKRMYQSAKAGTLAGWRAIFLPWFMRPGRDAAWYAARQKESLTKDGTLDSVHEQYPATDAEALAQKSGSKRLAPDWLLGCYAPRPPLPDALLAQAPPIANLIVYALPTLRPLGYVIGADPAEGNPTSDDSAVTVLDRATGEEVAALIGKIEPGTLGGYLAQLARWYAPVLPGMTVGRPATVLIERNNHGHAVLLACIAAGVTPATGLDGKAGWLTNGPGKTTLYDTAAEILRGGDAQIRTFTTFLQLGSIEGNTLNAPEGQHDDAAMSFVLALQGRRITPAPAGAQYNYLTQPEDTPDGY